MDIWCIGLAYVDKKAKDNKRVKNLGTCWDLIDETSDAKTMKKIPNKFIDLFQPLLQKRVMLRKFGLTKIPNLLQCVKKFATQKENKFTPFWWRLRLPSLNAQYHPLKVIVAVTRRIMDTSTFKKLRQFFKNLSFRKNCSIDFMS